MFKFYTFYICAVVGVIIELYIPFLATCAEHNPRVHYLYYTGKVKVKQLLGVPGDGDSQISRQSAHEGGKVVSPMHRPPLPPS